jgi:cytosine deaminase
MDNTSDEFFMEEAYKEALKGYSESGIPIGSVLVHNDKIIGRGHNQRVQKGSVILHGEMDALENAGRQTAKTYRESVIYTTLSPCPMCSGAILLYGIPKVVIGENQTFMGDENHLISHGVELKLMNHSGCKSLMEKIIEEKPALWNEDNGED